MLAIAACTSSTHTHAGPPPRAVVGAPIAIHDASVSVASHGGSLAEAADAASSTDAPAPSAACPAQMAAIPGGTYKLKLTAAWFGKAEVTLAPYCLDRTQVTVSAYGGVRDRGGVH